ncbi:MAG TPA: response regulator [Pirellulales bacterium]|nr:response regulator [Pirellulales bacterium]
MESDYSILLVDDSPEDTQATLRAFQRVGLVNRSYHCKNGTEALDFLHQRGQYAAPIPPPRLGMILLDLNLPGIDGREVLDHIKRDEQLKTIPVLVLTTSTDERDIQKCYQVGANCYINKPVDFGGFVRSIQRIKEFWFETAILPQRTGE